MIDARRMEVYSAFYDMDNNLVRKIQADIVNKSSYLNLLKKKVTFFGDGSLKIKEIIKHKNAVFISDFYHHFWINLYGYIKTPNREKALRQNHE